MHYNEALADEMGVSEDNRVKMDDAYERLIQVCNYPETHEDPEKVVTDIEFELQALWGFPQDPKFHRYQQYIKGCTCPRLDNRDLIGVSEHRYRVSDCPWHWKED